MPDDGVRISKTLLEVDDVFPNVLEWREYQEIIEGLREITEAYLKIMDELKEFLQLQRNIR